MKKLLSFVFVAFMFVACGDSPEAVAKKYMTALVEGNVEQAAKCQYFDSEDDKHRFIKVETKKFRDNKKYFAIRGGVKSIETSLIEMNKVETTAKVKSVMTFNNGEADSIDLNLIKIDGTWYITWYID